MTLDNLEGLIKELSKKIIKIRESWGEVSEYCQDEIMEEVENGISLGIAKGEKRVIREIDKWVIKTSRSARIMRPDIDVVCSKNLLIKLTKLSKEG